MKTLIKNSNPFIMLLIPVMFALILGVTYQFEQKKETAIIGRTAVHATSLFHKGFVMVKTVCSVAKNNNIW
ncbi:MULTISPECIES: hypothetical protein [Mucilaginibacter]|uniref:Uncharacterized protein n=1 Tax=Mucilaginibacter rubeus TaxID=2027860 RepID=A0A5C1I3L0_9SPHI|nr:MULTISPECIES: hypothetical protein [Mucilaginibacter]QEM12324.1 hypothetical protein DEO27_020650 [Mucilaginibacter rubeus]